MKMMSKPLIFNTLRCFADVTPESAEHGDWFTTGIYTLCYRTCRDREETLHVRRPTA